MGVSIWLGSSYNLFDIRGLEGGIFEQPPVPYPWSLTSCSPWLFGRGSPSTLIVYILSRNLVDSSTDFFSIPRFLPVEREECCNPFPRGMPEACKDFFVSFVILDLVEVFSFSFDDIVDASSFFDHIHEDLVRDDSSE